MPMLDLLTILSSFRKLNLRRTNVCLIKLEAVILNIRCDFVLAALAVFDDEKNTRHFINKQSNRIADCELVFTLMTVLGAVDNEC